MNRNHHKTGRSPDAARRRIDIADRPAGIAPPGALDERRFLAYLEERRSWIDRALQSGLPSADTPPQRLHEAMRYSLFAGGKRIRPILAIASFETVAEGGRPPDINDAIPLIAAIELIHTYSLIHDDLPAMDDDDYRRGRPTNHKKFGEAAAILAGDALLTAAFIRLSDSRRGGAIPSGMRLAVIREIAEASGSLGMAGGQFVDIESEGLKGDGESREATLRFIHARKTGRLIRAAVRVGAILGDAGPEALSCLTAYGEKTGLLFQIADDILDVEGTRKETGKRVGKDAARKKLTYPAVLGLEPTRRHADRLQSEALASLESFGPEAGPLRSMVSFIMNRRS